MSQQPSPTTQGQNGAHAEIPTGGVAQPATDNGDGRPRLGPRPLLRPTVDPGQAAVFSRPQGVDGAFATPHAPGPGQYLATGGRGAPPPAPLAEAFSRSRRDADVALQRPPGQDPAAPEAAVEPVFWSAGADSEQDGSDPWREPGAAVMLGPPALGSEEEDRPLPQAVATRLSAPELLFGRRVKPTALLALLGAALLVGAVGGLVGWGVGRGSGSLTDPGVTLVQAVPGMERAAGSVANLAKRVSPAVVSIEVVAGNSGAIGSGVVIDGKGYVLTNNHVVTMAAQTPSAKMTVVFSDGSRVQARIVGRDPKSDLAVIKVEVNNPTVIQLGKSSDLQVGDAVIAIGSPLGLAGTVTQGVVSALDRPMFFPGEGGDPAAAYSAIQTDAAINPGNSGGALVDSRGTLIGINSSIKTQTGNSVGLGFAIPIDVAKPIAEELIRSGQVKHADLGVNVKSVMSESSTGAEVQNVQQGGAAANAGIAEGDVITKFGDRLIRSAEELIVAARQHRIGETVPVQLMRQGSQLTLPVTLKSD
jgi:S1-C subfamily serine protease